MVLNAAVQMLREADELKQKILKFKSGTSMLQEGGLWATQQQLQKVYQKVLVLDLDYALDKKVEQDLWNIGFKQQIEALQAISKDRKNPLRSEGQAMLSWVLQAAAGFYLCLLHQICTTFKLDLPFRRRASLLGWVEGWGVGCGEGAPPAPPAPPPPPPAAARYICQHCLVHLGDLARYRHHLRVAYTFYRQAVVVWAGSGQPYNQLALVSWRRGRRLAALYWHVRSVLVAAPFPPAPENLARTLRAAATAARTSMPKDLPVIPGVTPAATETPQPKGSTSLLDGHAYVTELIRAMHLIYTVENLDSAASIVDSLNSSLTALIAIDSFESMTLIKMAVVLMWLVHTSTEDGMPRASLSEAEGRAASLAESLAAAAVLALLLPNYTAEKPLERTLPALKVWLDWLVCVPQCARRGGWAARPQIWPALAHTLNCLARSPTLTNKYETVPLPEDEEIHGFLPLEEAYRGLKFASHAAWDTYGGALPDLTGQQDQESPCEVSATSLSNEPEVESKVRAHRIVQLGVRLAQLRPEHLAYELEDEHYKFSSMTMCGEQLSAAVAELSGARGCGVAVAVAGAGGDEEADTDDETPPPPPPVVISEADFREKVREKRVGILKPQGSLERAREERAMATQEDTDENGEDLFKGEDKKEVRKARVNIAMAAIMRKQEETNKQVKFVTPPPTPDSTTDAADTKDQDKPKVIQPKAIKSLANLPIGRKTGGILSLKDKSAGYPHLVNTDPEPAKKEDKKDTKPSQGSSQQGYQKRQDTPQNWGPNLNAYNESRMGFPKNYATQSAGYNSSVPPPISQGIRLPVVNPKEIDVRTAALQKQNSRQELFHDGQKFSNQNYQITNDKKNFLNDLPPRFANQYRYWQTTQENQFNDNKFRDENFKPNNSLFNTQQRPNWMPDSYQQPAWWKPESATSFNANYAVQPVQMPNFYATPLATNLPNPYQALPSFQMQNQSIGQTKQENLINPPGYLQSSLGQPQLPSIQNLVSSPNYTSPLNSFGTYAPAVSYDSSMYPQFSNKLGYQPLQMKMMDKPQLGYQGSKDLMDMSGLGFGTNVLDMQQRNLNMGFSDSRNSTERAKSLEHTGSIGGSEGATGTAVASNTYSLFSGAQDAATWGGVQHPQPHQSLWSGPGPSPLERLLEQQKQLKQQQPPAPQ